MKNKKSAAICLIAVLMISLLTGCGAAKAETKADATIDLSSFKTVDLEENEVTQDIFKDYDMTMINVWTTWCPYCIEEMPELETVYQKLPENVNFITICMDADKEKEEAKRLMKETGTTFRVLVGNEELQDKVNQYLDGYPSTFYVDKDGHVVGAMRTGAPAGNVAEAYTKEMEAALAIVEGRK